MTNNFIEEYYNNFKIGKNTICLTFYYNYKFNSANYDPNTIIPQFNPEKILNHLDILLKYYINEKFKCNIKINDELWITDLDNRDKIVEVFIHNFSNSEYKPKYIDISCNIIHCLGEKYKWFISLINKFKQIGIIIRLKFETMLIDIVDVRHMFDIKDFLLIYVNYLVIRINPNNFAYFTQVFDSLYATFKNILYLYEEDNVNWTDYKVNEYIEFLNIYIDKIYTSVNNDNIQFLKELFFNDKLNLISLKDNIAVNNTCSFYTSLNILLEDLTINPCPKFQYNNQIIGQYNCDKEQIVDIELKSLQSFGIPAIKNLNYNNCSSCMLSPLCKGFCCKESYKYSFNASIPILENCIMKKAKYTLLFSKLKDFNILNLENFKEIPYIDQSYINYIFKLYNILIGEEA